MTSEKARASTGQIARIGSASRMRSRLKNSVRTRRQASRVWIEILRTSERCTIQMMKAKASAAVQTAI